MHDGDAEIKRMYVVPDARGRGHARALLAELEPHRGRGGPVAVLSEAAARRAGVVICGRVSLLASE